MRLTCFANVHGREGLSTALTCSVNIVFTPVVTDSGICCALNVESNLKESEYSHLVTEMQGPKKTKDLQKAASGIGKGLQVVIDQRSDR